MRLVVLILAVVLLPVPASGMQFGTIQYIDKEDLDNPYRTIYLTDTWRYHPGDNLRWAEPDFDDFFWEDVSTLLGTNQLPFIEWEGIGWFRLTIDVDKSLVGKPLSLDVVVQSGASEIYLDGDLLYSFGNVSSDPLLEKAYQERKPRTILFTRPGIHVLAVRYSNHNAVKFLDSGYNAGFRYLLVEMNHQVDGLLTTTRQITIQQYLYTGILLVFTIIHLLLFLFYPKQLQNLYFALFTASFGSLNYLNFQTYFSTSGAQMMSIHELQFIFVILTMVFFLLFSYSLFYDKIPRQFWLLLVAIVLTGISLTSQNGLIWERIFIGIVVLFTLEIIRILAIAIYRKKKGSWIFSAGMTLFLASQIYTAGINLDFFSGGGSQTVELAGISGIIALLITMSVSLSRGVAETNKRLESKLREVQTLSMKALEQEREQKARELDRLLLEADNKRKTEELEEARKLQISMLPADMPAVGFAEFAVSMRTATEVGGDYYDYVLSDEGELTVAVGDATGHGVKAGIVVATAKSYFKTFAENKSNIELIRIMSQGVKNMNLRMIYMTLTLLKYHRDSIKIVGAGMPPCLLYRSKSRTVEQVLSKGMPLGSIIDYPYIEIEKKVEEGDVLVMLSDGIPEAFNPKREMFGMDRIQTLLAENGEKSPQEIIETMEKAVSKWMKSEEPEDDFTVLIIKFHPQFYTVKSKGIS